MEGVLKNLQELVRTNPNLFRSLLETASDAGPSGAVKPSTEKESPEIEESSLSDSTEESEVEDPGPPSSSDEDMQGDTVTTGSEGVKSAPAPVSAPTVKVHNVVMIIFLTSNNNTFRGLINSSTSD